MYLCELIICYIVNIIEKYYLIKHPIAKTKKNITYKTNKSNFGEWDI